MPIRFLRLCLVAAVASLLSACGDRATLSNSEWKSAREEPPGPPGPQVLFPDSNPDLADGKVAYHKMGCVECHGEHGEGSNFKALHLLNDPSRMETDKMPTEQFRILYYGVPAWDHPVLKGKWSIQEVWDVIFFARSLSIPPLTSGEMERLGKVFGANCADCHGENGYGDGQLRHNLNPTPANFHQFNRFFDREDTMLYNHIADGLYPASMPSFFGRRDLANNVLFDKKFIVQMVRYVRHFHTQYDPAPSEKDATNSDSNKTGVKGR